MEYFKHFSSNTYAGSGNQLYFELKANKTHTGRLFYKISAGGKYNYAVLFSNTIDSTYSDGTSSRKNMLCDEWIIHSARVGKCIRFNEDKNVSELFMSDGEISSDIIVSDFKGICFNGQKTKKVAPGELFSSDSVELEFKKGEYLCLEIVFSGKRIPYHEETLIPVFLKEGSNWKYLKFMPFANMIGCDRTVKGKIAYLGDSITQGIGTKPNSYLHWNAILSEKLGSEYSYWNLGLGYGRASDAASDGVWLHKARQNDVIFACYGVNDILHGETEEQIKSNLKYIVNTLKNEGKKVIMQTIPPFNYKGENIEKWKRLNSYILSDIKETVDFVFDNVEYLGKKDFPEEAIYGDHPNEEGCELWANALWKKIIEHNIL